MATDIDIDVTEDSIEVEADVMGNKIKFSILIGKHKAALIKTAVSCAAVIFLIIQML